MSLFSCSWTDWMNENTGSVHMVAVVLGSPKGLRVQIARPPSLPSSPFPTSAGLVKSVSISGREHVCVCAGAPRAHANWGPKGKAFHTDLSQLPCSKHSIARRVEERSDLHASPLPVCSKYTGKAAASSTNGRQASTNCRFRSCIGVRRSVTASYSQDSKGTCCPERGAFQASWPLRLSRISLCGGG